MILFLSSGHNYIRGQEVKVVAVPLQNGPPVVDRSLPLLPRGLRKGRKTSGLEPVRCHVLVKDPLPR